MRQLSPTDGCAGWRADGRCTGPDGKRLAHPHAECLHTLYRARLAAVDHTEPTPSS